MTDFYACSRVRHFEWVVFDALDTARRMAVRAQDEAEGMPDAALFQAARAAIFDFAHNHPAMIALRDAATRGRV